MHFLNYQKYNVFPPVTKNDAANIEHEKKEKKQGF